jgi:hypothetical protein
VRRIVILFLFLGSFQLAFGQSKFSAGPFVGFNFAKLSTGVETVSGTARPFVGLFGQYHPVKLLSVEMNTAFSMRGQRFDQTTARFEGNFIDAHFLIKIHFLKDFSFGTGIGYYHTLNARTVNRFNTDVLFRRDFENPDQLSQMVVPLELGFRFQNQATLHFTYGYALNEGFNNPAITFRFPIRRRPKGSKPPSKLAVAKSQIRALDEGVLLVRLRTAQPLIDKLNDIGSPEQAEVVMEKVEKENREIVNAFNSLYDFSEVYFFYNTFSTQVKDGNLSSLMDAEMETISLDRIDTVDFFIAEFANLKPDTGRYYIDNSIESAPNGGLRRIKRYGDYDIGANIQVLVIKDRNFVQLRDPFPYYERSVLNSLSPISEALQRPIPIISKNKHRNSYQGAVHILDSRMKLFRKRARTKEEKQAEQAIK